LAAHTRTLLPLLLLGTLPAAVRAQFNYEVNNGTIAITGYTGPGGAVTIPDTIAKLPVTSIGGGAFYNCTSLTSVTIPNRVTSIGSEAFSECAHLTSVYFDGNAPSLGQDVFSGADNVTVYYQPGTTGWGATFGGRPTAVWKPQVQTGAASFGVRANEFGFTVAWARDRVVVVEATTDIARPIWTPVSTNTLTGGTAYFSDADWVRHRDRFYRVRSP